MPKNEMLTLKFNAQYNILCHRDGCKEARRNYYSRAFNKLAVCKGSCSYSYIQIVCVLISDWKH